MRKVGPNPRWIMFSQYETPLFQKHMEHFTHWTHSSRIDSTALQVHKNNGTVFSSQEKGTNLCFLGMSCDSRGSTLICPRDEELQSKAGVSGYCEGCRNISQELLGVHPWVISLLVNFRRTCEEIEAGGKMRGMKQVDKVGELFKDSWPHPGCKMRGY